MPAHPRAAAFSAPDLHPLLFKIPKFAEDSMIALLSSWINYGLIIARAYRGDHAMRRFVIMLAEQTL